jgi:PAS domain S-box-containing protein
MVPTQGLLKRQLKRFFGTDSQIPSDWQAFLAAVDAAYAEFAVDRDLMERSMELSSQELLEANSELQAIFQAVPDQVFRLDHTGTILAVNAGEHAEAPKHALLGRRIQECWFNQSGDGLSEALRRVINEKSMIGIEYSEDTDGRPSYHEVRLVPLLENQVVAISRDITERKNAEAKLEQMHRQLVDASRHAGMAEIANNVLHNVGNVLNSVNVSAGVVTQMVRESKGQGLASVVKLLGEEGGELGQLFSQNEKAIALRGYLAKLVTALAAEKEAIAKELDSLIKSIDHINEIVAAQQSYSGSTTVAEPVQISELLEDALRINAGSIDRHQITVVREYAQLPMLLLDKHLVLQVLVNLIGNAGQAMQALPGRSHQLKLRTEVGAAADEERRLRICVEDNGEGIAPEHLSKLFTHGFTTRKSGHGFGLHSCALAAKEMRGAVAAHSQGSGHGALFTLELPLIPA